MLEEDVTLVEDGDMILINPYGHDNRESDSTQNFVGGTICC